jgi:hypothetical protein
MGQVTGIEWLSPRQRTSEATHRALYRWDSKAVAAGERSAASR